ncbi:pentatricopeptide repeat-containing protein At2g17033 [Nicotiana tabacum]|uniref:Pentatricopeptide repeat-containing protein At2g17033 n=1 Tax=Nicotiana tabacum TaxID=4097 RepID=A0A1S3ZV50_TOBAC|nr:PREDICTED: pentatricopeptide repeat-containing protein At2g17033-like [Nicotiana tabacum]XP_016468301.1 PREDICTED: pentatricopeptide repeat-containing protein At2g17033-like [Nicotiana tabacum]
MIGSILLPAPVPLPSHRISLRNRHSQSGSPRCSLSKQGHRFISTLIATDSDDISATHRLLRKFVASSSKHVALSTLSHLLSPTTSHLRLSSLALPLYLEISEASWFDWNSKLVADLVALLYKLERFDEAETLVTETVSKLGGRERDLCSFYSQLIHSQSKHKSEKGVLDFCTKLKLFLSCSSSVYLKQQGYASMVDAFCSIGLPRDAEELIEEMKELGLKLSKFEFRALVYSYGKSGFFSDMKRIVGQMESMGLQLDTVGANMVLNSFGSQYELSEMVSWLQKMDVSGVPFSIRTYNSVLNSCPTISLLLQDPKSVPLSLEELLANLNENEASLVKILVGSSVLEETMQWNPSELKLDLHGMHLSSAYVIILQWFHQLQCKLVAENRVLPAEITVVCGAGKHSVVRGESPVKGLIKELLLRVGCPLRIDRKNIGCFIGKGKSFMEWLSNNNTTIHERIS